MATVKIGGKELDLPELNFKSIKKIWPLVKDITETEDLVQLMDVASQVLSIALARSSTPKTVEEIEDELLGSEIPSIQGAVENLLIESGLLQRVVPESGEAPAAEESRSTETGTELSPSLSQPELPAETGTQ